MNADPGRLARAGIRAGMRPGPGSAAAGAGGPVGIGADFSRLWREHWLAGALGGAPLLLALVPLLGAWPGWLLLTFLVQPLYMLHQLEEHLDDRFRRYVNHSIAGGREALTHTATAVINIGGVWAVNAVALLGAALLAPGWALLAGYLALVNGVVHGIAALAKREYNPGLVTGLLLLVPGGIAAVVAVSLHTPAGITAHLLALGAILLLHAAIIAHVKRTARRLA
jgi:hypothetical protein